MDDRTAARTIEAARSDRHVRLASGLPDSPAGRDVMFREETYSNFWRNFIFVGGPRLANEPVAPAPVKEFDVDTAFIRLDATRVLSKHQDYQQERAL
ncbi:MAG: hypothetical protein LBQ79_03345 [Deltaproteobacteria bacterium]|jgi:hypothetical protein|nr:hypothetical protein [Deltaproteobacteria bacterium]